MLKLIGDYYTDENGNKCFAFHYSQEEAEKAARTLAGFRKTVLQ